MKNLLFILVLFACGDGWEDQQITPNYWHCYGYNSGVNLEGNGVTCLTYDCVLEWEALCSERFNTCGCEPKFD